MLGCNTRPAVSLIRCNSISSLKDPPATVSQIEDAGCNMLGINLKSESRLDNSDALCGCLSVADPVTAAVERFAAGRDHMS
jgi:hypothetical protein